MRKLAAGLGLSLGLVFGSNVDAGPIGIGDFSGFETVTTFDGLGLPFNNVTPLVFDGNTYTTDDGVLRYSSAFEADCSVECIGNNTELGFINVALGAPATRVGARVGGGTTTYSGFVEFFGAGDALLGTIVFGPGDTSLQFAGWEDLGGITRFRVTDTAANNRIVHLEDFRFEDAAAVPEPTTLVMFGTGLAAIRLYRRRRMR